MFELIPYALLGFVAYTGATALWRQNGAERRREDNRVWRPVTQEEARFGQANIVKVVREGDAYKVYFDDGTVTTMYHDPRDFASDEI